MSYLDEQESAQISEKFHKIQVSFCWTYLVTVMYSIMIITFYKMLLGKTPPISVYFLQLFSSNKHDNKALVFLLGLPGGGRGREPAWQCKRHERCKFDPCIQKIPWSRAWQLAPIFLAGESHGHRSLAGYSP